MLTCLKPIVQRESKNIRQCTLHVMLSWLKPEMPAGPAMQHSSQGSPRSWNRHPTDHSMASNAALYSRLRTAETVNQQTTQLARDFALQSRLRAAETNNQWTTRLASNAALHSRLCAAENQQSCWLGSDDACHARLRDAETPYVWAAWERHDREQHNRHRGEETPQKQEARQARDALCHQETHRARVEQARKNNHNLARCDDANFFQEKLMPMNGKRRGMDSVACLEK